MYDQFELFSCERMRHQIVLLKDCIRNMKLTFNKEFDEVLKLKEAEIKRIKVCTRHGERVPTSFCRNIQCIRTYIITNLTLSLNVSPSLFVVC